VDAAVDGRFAAVSGESSLAPHEGWLLWLHACFFGLTWGARGPAITAKTADLFPGRQLGTILGVIMIGSGLGSAAGSCWLDFRSLRQLPARPRFVDRRLSLPLHRLLGLAPASGHPMQPDWWPDTVKAVSAIARAPAEALGCTGWGCTTPSRTSSRFH